MAGPGPDIPPLMGQGMNALGNAFYQTHFYVINGQVGRLGHLHEECLQVRLRNR